MEKDILSKEDIVKLKELGLKIRKLHLIELVNDPLSDIDAIVKKQRWTGSTCRKVSMPDLFEDHESNLKSLVLMKKNYELFCFYTDAMSKVLSHYRKCPNCRGIQGQWSGKQTAHVRAIWIDCDECHGHGYINETI